jgi:hypothetical protein
MEHAQLSGAATGHDSRARIDEPFHVALLTLQ